MEEHHGLTLNVCAAILRKSSLVGLLQKEDTRAGTAQRLFNMLAQYPTLLKSTAAQRTLFQLAEAAARIGAKVAAAAAAEPSATERKEEENENDENDGADSPSHASAMSTGDLYALAFLQQCCDMRALFSPAQSARLEAYAETFLPLQESLQRELDSLRRKFVEATPFAHLRLAPFTVAGVKARDLQPAAKEKGKTKRSAPVSSTALSSASAASASSPSAAAAAAAVPAAAAAPDIPYSFLPRSLCARCGLLRGWYCVACMVVVHPLARAGGIPRVALPLEVSIVLHPNVAREKSTALQLLLLSSDRGMVQEHLYPSLPVFDPAETVVVFPSDDAWTAQSLAQAMGEHRSAAAAVDGDADTNGLDASSAARPVFPLKTLRRLVFLEATWSEARQMLSHAHLRSLVALRLDLGQNGPRTSFWRFQSFGAGFLSSIEAIHHCFRQLQPHLRVLAPQHSDAPAAASPSAAVASPSLDSHAFDDLLWLFAMSHGRLQRYYTQHPQLLPPSAGQEFEAEHDK